MNRLMTGAGALGAVGVMMAMGAVGLEGGSSASETNAPAIAQPQGDMGQQLAEGLKKTEGCLGVDLAQWQSGKNTICAWFENKDAVERWYYSESHSGFMGAVGSDPEDRKPLRHVKTEGPIMVMATISFNGPPAVEGGKIPFSQIAIELFEPLPGGAHINGRLAPEKFKVEHMRDLTP